MAFSSFRLQIPQFEAIFFRILPPMVGMLKFTAHNEAFFEDRTDLLDASHETVFSSKYWRVQAHTRTRLWKGHHACSKIKAIVRRVPDVHWTGITMFVNRRNFTREPFWNWTKASTKLKSTSSTWHFRLTPPPPFTKFCPLSNAKMVLEQNVFICEHGQHIDQNAVCHCSLRVFACEQWSFLDFRPPLSPSQWPDSIGPVFHGLNLS